MIAAAQLEAALGLRARPLGRGEYSVTDGANEYRVDVGDRRCVCAAAGCAHLLAALLAIGDPWTVGQRRALEANAGVGR